MPGPGRPTKYSPEMQKKICDKLKVGNTRTASVWSSGITYDTFSDWMGNNPEFSSAIHEAESAAEALFANRVAKEVIDPKGDWRASQFWLTHRRNKDWRAVTASELSGPGGGPIEIKEIDEEAVLAASERIKGNRKRV